MRYEQLSYINFCKRVKIKQAGLLVNNILEQQLQQELTWKKQNQEKVKRILFINTVLLKKKLGKVYIGYGF